MGAIAFPGRLACSQRPFVGAGAAIAPLYSLDQTSDFCLSERLGLVALRGEVGMCREGPRRGPILRKAELSRRLVLERLPILGDDFALLDGLFLRERGRIELEAAPVRGTAIEPAGLDRAPQGLLRQLLIRLLA